MTLSPTFVANEHRKLARRLQALGADVGEVDVINHTEASRLKLMDAMIGVMEAQAREKQKA